MTIDPEEKLLAAIREEESDFTEALREANDILYPDPAKVLAAAISERKTAVAEWKDCLKQCDAMAADLEAIRGMVGRYGHGVAAVEAVRSIVAALDEARAAGRESCATTANGYRSIAGALGILDSQASVPSILAAIADMVNKIADLSSSLKAAEADAKTQRTAADDLRAALDRVAVAAGVDTDSTGAIVADRVIAVIRAMQARPVLTVERLADALRAANVTLEPSTTALARWAR